MQKGFPWKETPQEHLSSDNISPPGNEQDCSNRAGKDTSTFISEWKGGPTR